MRFPVGKGTKEDFDKYWYSAQGFGNPTTYGFHCGEDINLRTGANTDLGQPLYAIADGEVTSVHSHATGFGKHLHIGHDGPWGTVWSHYAHCDTVTVKVGDKVKEGQKVGTLGSSGNSQYAHLHFAIKLQPTGVDGIAKTKEDLKKWTDPLAFIEKYLNMNQDDDCQTKLAWYEKEYPLEKQRVIDARRDREELTLKLNALQQEYSMFKADVKVEIESHKAEAIAQKKKFDDLIREVAMRLDTTQDVATIYPSLERLVGVEDLYTRLQTHYEDSLKTIAHKESTLIKYQEQIDLLKEEARKAKGLGDATTADLINEIIKRLVQAVRR